jgi:hypothetical protein
MAISVQGLISLCQKNVVELKFVRRTKMKIPPTRRMLCTLNERLLNSAQGKKVLKFKPPTHPPPYNAAAKGLATVWDILLQDWRNVSTESVEVVSAIDIVPEKKFWEFFNEVLRTMSAAQKKSFMEK